MRSHYELLEVAPDADAADIESAYLQFSRTLNPDRPNGSSAMVTEAYEVLRDPQKRATYDQSLIGGASTPHVPPGGSTTRGPMYAAAYKKLQTPIAWAILPLLIVAVLLVVLNLNNGSTVPGVPDAPTVQGTSAPSGGATTAPRGATPVNQAKVGALMKKISANPKDTASLQALGDLYHAAKDDKKAVAWEQKVLTVDPKNLVALLAAGAGQFNLGNYVKAKQQWLVAARLYPNNAEVHYDLGFLYMSQTPPDTAKQRAEWRKVVAIDPGSNLAKTVSSYLK